MDTKNLKISTKDILKIKEISSKYYIENKAITHNDNLLCESFTYGVLSVLVQMGVLDNFQMPPVVLSDSEIDNL
jgi:hypothetical protein